MQFSEDEMYAKDNSPPGITRTIILSDEMNFLCCQQWFLLHEH